MRLAWRRQPLVLRHSWTTSHGSSQRKETIVVTLTDADASGSGEVTPVSYHGQSLTSAEAALGLAMDALAKHGDVDEALASMPFTESAARAGLDAARWDLEGRRAGKPVHALLPELPPLTEVPRTGLSVGIGDLAGTVERVRDATRAGFAIVKIKLGTGSPRDDEALVRAIREAVPGVRLRVDANEAWPTFEAAVEHLAPLLAHQIELIEQPLPRAALGDSARLRDWLVRAAADARTQLVLDEACASYDDIDRCAGHCDVVNLKMSKCGGITEMLRMARRARARGLGVMLGCMIESSLGVAAAAQLASVAQHLDLDGHLLLDRDPWTGLEDRDGRVDRLCIDRHPGLGVVPREA